MKKSHMCIFLTVGIVNLLVFSSCIPGILSTGQSNTLDVRQDQNIEKNDGGVITCYIGGVPESQPISYESGTYLTALFSKLAIANAHDPVSAETQQLQHQILLYAEQNGLLPTGTSAEMMSMQFEKRSKTFVQQTIHNGPPRYAEGTGKGVFCNFVSTGQGSAFPIIILPRLIPLIMTPIPRLYVGWKTPEGITSCGSLRSGTGFIASGQQQGFALGFWGIGFSIFLPPIMAYGMFGYAIYAKATAEDMGYYPPNNPPEVNAMYPLDGATYVPLSTSGLQFHISDLDRELMSYSVTTFPDVGGGTGNLKPDGTYTVPISGLKSSTKYTWQVNVSDGLETIQESYTFTTEAIASIVSE